MRGGLHNQLMTLTSYAVLATKTNRTLVLPQFLANFPNEEQVPAECEDIFDVDVIQRKGMFPSAVVPLCRVPAGLFVIRPATVNLDTSTSLKPRDTTRCVEKLTDKKFHEANMTVVEKENQLMKDVMLTPLHETFQLNRRLSTALEDCLRFTPQSCEIDPSIDWDCIVVVHLRIESDWLRYSRRKERIGLRFEDHHLSLSEIQGKFRNSTFFDGTKSPRKTILLSYAAGKLPPNTPDLHHGWPVGYRVVTSDQLHEVVGQYNYLERSVLMSKIALNSGIFVGNTFSSFSKIISGAREAKLPVEKKPHSFTCNTPAQLLPIP